MATWANIFATLLNAASFGTSTNARLAEDLQSRSEVLTDISRSFVDRSKALRIVSFFESDMMDIMNAKV